MKKSTALANYRKFTASQGYIIGFIHNHQLYMIRVDDLKPRWLTMMSATEHHQEKLQMNLKAKHKKQLINKGAMVICSEAEFLEQNTIHNKGYTFERIVFEMNGKEWKRDNTRFDKQGDIRIDGMEIQIKFENAQVATITTLKRLQRTL
jgi:hypothetical protein